MDLSVILPAYEEAANLSEILPRLTKTLSNLGVSYEVLVVDTVEPRDDTLAVSERNGVCCLRRSPSDSFGDAYRSGIRASRGRRVAFMDADGSHPPEFIADLYAETARHDIVIASRYVRGGGTENNPVLELMSRILNVSYALILGIRCRDMSNSFKIYDGKRLRALCLRCDHFDVVEEVMVGFARDGQGLRIKELPFKFRQRREGQSKRNLFTFILSYIYTLLRLRFRAWPDSPSTESFAEPREDAANEKAA